MSGFATLSAGVGAVLLFAVAVLGPTETAAADSVERIVRSVRGFVGDTVPTLEDVRERCGSKAVCAARVMASAIGPRARLERVIHPSSDQIRWVDTTPSVTGSRLGDDGVMTVELRRFGRKAVPELRETVDRAFQTGRRIDVIALDLRFNHGGDFERMLQVAALFTGPVPDAVRLVGWSRTTTVALPEAARLQRGACVRVLAGPRTASSAEVLAALLKVHAKAQILGATTYGKDYLTRIVPVTHDLALRVPAERIEVPGVTLTGGIVPDIEVPGS